MVLSEDVVEEPQYSDTIPYGTSQADGTFQLESLSEPYDVPYGDYYLSAWEYDQSVDKMVKLGSMSVTVDEAEENFTFRLGGA